MKACAAATGVSFSKGQRPSFTEDQKTQLDTCLEAKEAAMKSCLSSAGVQLPAPPNPGERPSGQPPRMDKYMKSKIDNCRAQALAASDASNDNSGSNAEAENNGSAL
jgi:hypothetical protein